MLASEIRKLAREALAGKWGKAAILSLVYAILTYVISFALNLVPIVGPIAQAIIEVPLAFGFILTMLKLMKGEEISYVEFFANGFSNFSSSWMVSIWTAIRLIVPIILEIVGAVIMVIGFGPSAFNSSSSYVGYTGTDGVSVGLGIVGCIIMCAASIWLTVKSYSYRLAIVGLAEDTTKNPKDVVDDCAKMMEGNRWRLFCLELSFIGWSFLAVLSCGIGMLWLAPYILVAEIIFFEKLAGTPETTSVTETTEVAEAPESNDSTEA